MIYRIHPLIDAVKLSLRVLIPPAHRVSAWMIAGIFFSTAPLAAPHEKPDSSSALDKQVATTLSLLAEGDLAEARVLARQMARRFPDYALGQLLSAELESTAAFSTILTHGNHPMNQPLMDLLLEAQARLSHSQHAINGQSLSERSVLPDSVIQLGSHTSQLLIVDLHDSMLYQFMGSDQKPTLVRHHYVGSGKAGYGKQVEGDNKTPLGIYSITGLRSDASLPDLYGSGALMLDYPNALDRYLDRTGSGIWLHGVPHAQRSRSPRSSEGCVTMSNDHLLQLKQRITPSDTLVILGHEFNWSDSKTRRSKQKDFQRLFEQFQRSWADGNREALLALYHDAEDLEQRFLSTGGYAMRVSDAGGVTLQSEATLHHVASQRYLQDFADVDPSDISIIQNPLQQGLNAVESTPYLVMQARFGHLNEHQITLYWRQHSDGRWRIVTEQWDGLDI